MNFARGQSRICSDLRVGLGCWKVLKGSFKAVSSLWLLREGSHSSLSTGQTHLRSLHQCLGVSKKCWDDRTRQQVFGIHVIKWLKMKHFNLAD